MKESLQDLYKIDSLEDSDYTSCGRNKIYKDKKTNEYKFMGQATILDYLGLQQTKTNKNFIEKVKTEFLKFEKKYMNNNVDFALNTDFEDNKIKYNIIEKGELLSVFTL